MNNKIKKIVSTILAIVLIFTNTSIYAYASNHNEYSSNNSLFIFSKECSEAYIEYAKNNIYRYISDFAFNSNTVELGMPFTFSNQNSDVFYFPVLDDNKIVLLFRVFKAPEGITGVCSEFLCEELQAYVSLATRDNPLYLYMEKIQL